MNVSLSRGREGLRIYTDDKVKLRECAGRSAARQSAMEFLGAEKKILKRPDQRGIIVTAMNRWWNTWQREREGAKRARETDLCKEVPGITKGRGRGIDLEISS